MLIKKAVPFFNYPWLFTHDEEGMVDVFRAVCKRGAFIMQKDLEEFETRLATYTGAKYALGVGNATDALQLLMIAGGLGSGDEVIFCSHTMVATASAIHFTGAIPVPAEVGADHLIDLDSVRAAIGPRTKAIMPTQLNGRTADMDRLQSIADEYGLQIYEDSAQALGSRFKGRSAGTFGVGGCISLYPAKVLGCFGDGGAVLCNDDHIYRKLRLLRDHGRNESGDVVTWGFNSRLDNVQAAILNRFFDRYDEVVLRRRDIAGIYQSRLGELNELALPPSPDSDPSHFDVYQNYEIEAERRDDLKEYLRERGVGTLIQWGGKAVHEFRALGFKQSLPRTEQMMQRALMLPMNMSLTDADVDYVCECIGKFYES